MSGKMDWRRARLAGKRALDFRFENDVPDRAARWLKAVERNQVQRQQRQREYRSVSNSSWVTSSSSAVVPW